MAVDAPTPLPWRPSDLDRERVARLLRDRTVDGRLSAATFEGRLERAYEARSRDELDELVSDLPPAGRLARIAIATSERISSLTARIEAAWREPRVERLVLPRTRTELLLGRARSCDCVIADLTVSRFHARIE